MRSPVAAVHNFDVNTDPTAIDAAEPEVVVVGSLNLDLSVRVQRFPAAGETVAGTGLVWGGGGKGANQAVAAARLGRCVWMVGAVGDDDAGKRLIEDLARAGVNTAAVRVDVDNPTGIAVIEVDESAENRIVVVPGANGALDVAALTGASGLLERAAVILVQFETPVELIAELSALAPAAKIVVNPAPAVDAAASQRLLDSVDFLVPNRHELAALDVEANPISASSPTPGGGADDGTGDNVEAMARRILARSSRLEAVVVTLGADGVAVFSRNAPAQMIPAVPVVAVDTTAAGDAFCAGFADGLLAGHDAPRAAQWAVRVAAVTVTGHGAQASLPTRAEVLAL